MVYLIFVEKYRRNLLIKFGDEISTYRLWRQNNNMKELAKFFWKEKTFWSDGYFSCSIGNVSK